MEEYKLQEEMVQAGMQLCEVTDGQVEASVGNFTQIEDALWEEYLQEDERNCDMTPERLLVRTRMEKEGTAQVVFAIMNLFFGIFIFCGWHISIGFLVGSCTFVGFILASILMCQACVAGCDENHVFMQGLLLYFPVKAGRLRRELYLLLWKYVGIQAGIICVPLLMNMCIAFRPDQFFITLGVMVLSMLAVGVLIIEGGMRRLKAKD